MSEIDNWESKLDARVGVEFAPVLACDEISAPAIRHWREVFGFPPDWSVPASSPAAMLPVWLAIGPSGVRPPGSAVSDATSALALLAEGGYRHVIGAGTEIMVDRPSRPGERLSYTSTLESVSAEKSTGLGRGRFATFRFTIRDQQGDTVGTLRFTQLAYRDD